MIPGDVVDAMMADMVHLSPVDDELREIIRHRLGLDLPVHVQYGRWIGGVLQGDLGVSLRGEVPITPRILARLPVTFELGVFAVMIGLLISLPIGIYSAIRQNTVGDYAGRGIAVTFISVPTFWTATMVLILGMVLSGTTMRMTRTMALEVLRQDYIRTAWSKGLEEKVVVMRHVLKNALIPVVTIVGFQLPILIGGSVILEQIFVLPGIGTLLLDAIQKRDYPVVSGINLFIATAVVLINLLIDLSYAFLDPRVRYR